MKITTSTNPYTGKKIEDFENHTEEEIEELLTKAHERFLSWRTFSFSKRRALVLALADEFLKNKKTYAETMVREMGKPIAQAEAEIEKCAWNCEYYAEHAELQLKKIGRASCRERT